MGARPAPGPREQQRGREAVEAARAGASGSGFSVVADEVRSLAHRTAEAARDTSAIIEKTIQDVEGGVQLVSSAQTAFHEVSLRIEGGTRVVAEIAESSDQQARGIAKIREAIGRIEAVTQNNASNAHEFEEATSAVDAQIQSTRQYLDGLAAILGVVNS